MAYRYPIPPPGYMPYDYSSSSSPNPEDRYNLPPRVRTFPMASPASRAAKGHVRSTSYSTPRVAEWHMPESSPPPPYYPTKTSYPYTAGAQYEYVSTADPYTPSPKGRRAHGESETPLKRHSSRSHRTRAHVRPDDAPDRVLDSSADEPMYTYIEPRAPSGRQRAATETKKPTRKANSYFFFSQAPAHDDGPVDTPKRSRARRPSNATPPTSKGKASKSPKVEKKNPPPPPREPTAVDCKRHNIPAGYSLKNWDPEDGPFLLLGSVFDSNSLGKWIYDWTFYHHSDSPITDVAGELWLLLIKFGSNLRCAEAAIPRLRRRDEREVVEDYAARGRHLWTRVQELLKRCEEFMWRGAERKGAAGKGGSGKVVMGEKSGIEFVTTVFGRDRELPRTEKIMSAIRLYIMRFDHDCEDILGNMRRPRSK